MSDLERLESLDDHMNALDERVAGIRARKDSLAAQRLENCAARSRALLDQLKAKYQAQQTL